MVVDSGAILYGAGLLAVATYLFLGISVLCDAHLCPALEKLSEQLKIPTALAAASLLSFGSSAPELIISMFGAVSEQTELSIPAVLTSALIAFAAIPPLVVCSVGPIKLRILEVARDAVCYAAALIFFIFINHQPEISAAQAALLVGIYVIYLAIVSKTSLPDEEENVEEGKEDAESTGSRSTASTSTLAQSGCIQSCTSGALTTTSAATSANLAEPLLCPEEGRAQEAEKEEEEEDEEEIGPILAALQKPFEIAFEQTISEQVVSAFALSLAWLCALSYGALVCAANLAEVWGLSPSTAGVTLLAWGGQLPDAIAAVALAKAGMPDAAISQAIASQVINVTIGLGAPLLTYTFLTGKPTVTEKSGTVSVVAVAVLISIVVYLIGMAPDASSWQEWRKGHSLASTITRARAIGLAVCFLCLYVGAIVVGEVRYARHLLYHDVLNV